MAKRKPADTPLMQQYLQIKAQNPDALLFFRCGDFYEMFFDDAIDAAAKLDIALTSRHKGSDDPIPMAGVPHHAARGYIAKLTEMGVKVALCEQMEDPSKVKGLVKREVVRLITPGIVLDDELLDPKSARYLAAIAADGADAGAVGGARLTVSAGAVGLAYLDVSTGDFHATEVADADALAAELARVGPREVLVDPDHPLWDELPARYPGAAYTELAPPPVSESRTVLEAALAGTAAELGLADRPLAARAAASALRYARATQPAGTLPLSRLHVYDPAAAVVLDETAVTNLELTHTMVGRSKRGSLLGVIDATRTAPGGRLLRRWLLYPLTEIAPIRRRQDAVEHLMHHASVRAEVRALLAHVHDIERLAGRVTLGVATPRDLGRLRDSAAQLPALAAALRGGAPAPERAAAAVAGDAGADDDGAFGAPALLRLDPALLAVAAEIHGRLAAALTDDPPSMAKDGGFVRAGYRPEVDELRALARGGKQAIAQIENREREATGIASLKIKHNRVFGYYIEITRSHLERVPDHYVRRQTIANGERYVTPELSELEAKVLTAQEDLQRAEEAALAELLAHVAERASALTALGGQIAAIDCLAALAEVAHTRRYVRPEVTDGLALDITEGRHPVVEQMVEAGAFVPNDCRLDPTSEQVLLITGPNMAGKSTYMRQVAQIVLLAQIGSFVPAARAVIGVVDRIFTRVGAADNLARGESTFMVEMREAGAILRGATRRSLVVLDEVGRGTSTFDGVSIAWAVTEYLHDAIGARTLFATHYHELCALAESRPRVRNVSVAVRTVGGRIAFLRQVVAGGASRSYGIDVAQLAGLPRSVIARARQILGKLEAGGMLGSSPQLSLFAAAQPDPGGSPSPAEGDHEDGRHGAGGEPDGRAGSDPIRERLAALDPHNTTPIEALAILAELRELAR